jgi:hypothetical protein
MTFGIMTLIKMTVTITINNATLNMIMSNVTTQPTMLSLTRLILAVLNVIMLSTATSWYHGSSLRFRIFL